MDMLLDSSHPLQLHPFSHESSFYVLKCSLTFSAESVFLIICAQGNTNIQMNEFPVNLSVQCASKTGVRNCDLQ